MFFDEFSAVANAARIKADFLKKKSIWLFHRFHAGRNLCRIWNFTYL